MSESGENGEPPLAFRPISGTGDVSLANYTRALRRALEKECIHKFENWSQKLKQVQIYKPTFNLLSSRDTVDGDRPIDLAISERESPAFRRVLMSYLSFGVRWV